MLLLSMIPSPSQAAVLNKVLSRQREEVLALTLSVLAEQEHRLVLPDQLEVVSHNSSSPP